MFNNAIMKNLYTIKIIIMTIISSATYINGFFPVDRNA